MRRAFASILLAGLVSAALTACAGGGGCPAACGGSPRHGFVPAQPAAAPPPASPPARPSSHAAPAAPAAPAEHHHGAMPAEVHRFHEILAPRWHAPEGAQRTQDTCGAIADFRGGAAAIAAAPGGVDAAAWAAAATDLAARVEDLAATCTTPPAPGFQAAFSALHDAFHRVMELAMKKP